VTAKPLTLTRAQVLAHRRLVQALDERLPSGQESLRQAAWAGLQDSMPRAALLAIHARVEGTGPSTWEDPALAQVWGPRFTTYVVPRQDVAAFTLGRYPDDARGRAVADDLAVRLRAFLHGRTMRYDEAADGLGEPHPNRLKYAATTGTVLLRWEGARLPTIWTIPPPEITPMTARLELARRYLHVYGPATPAAFAGWAGIAPKESRDAFDALRGALMPVRTPVGDGWILASDEPTFRAAARPTAPARLLPSGDPFYILQGADRELLVPDADRRPLLWTPRVWPGAVLMHGEVAGTWRRAGPRVAIETWRGFTTDERREVELEAERLPLPDLGGRIHVRWDP
jgi:hypothetical protein